MGTVHRFGSNSRQLFHFMLKMISTSRKESAIRMHFVINKKAEIFKNNFELLLVKLIKLLTFASDMSEAYDTKKVIQFL